MVKGYTFFNKSTGLEVREYAREAKNLEEGKVRLRFFTMDSSKKRLMFILDPDECYVLADRMKALLEDGEKFSLYHAFKMQNGEEITTKLSCEVWERAGKKGYSLVITRGDDRISVSFDEGRFLFAAELLKDLSLKTSWFKVKEQEINYEEVAYEEEEEKDIPTKAEGNKKKDFEEVSQKDFKAKEEEREEEENPFETERMEGEIQAIARSGKAFLIKDSWVNLKDETSIKGKIERGKKVVVIVSKSDGRYYAEKVEVK